MDIEKRISLFTVKMKCAGAKCGVFIGKTLPVGHELGELRMTVASQKFD